MLPAVVPLAHQGGKEGKAKKTGDLEIASRRTFWVAACAGIIVFGSLMGAAFVSQQYLQNVLGYSTLEAGAAFLPAVFCMVLVAPRSAKLVDNVKLPAPASKAIRLYAALRKQADREDQRASLAARRAVRLLRGGKLKMSARDAARLLGVSHQRVHQLAHDAG